MRHARRPSLGRPHRSVGPSGPGVPLQRRCIPRPGSRVRPTLRPMDAGSILPRLAWVRSYRRAALGRDVFAGIVLTAILIPAGMGYAEASGLPPIIGLYATILPLLAYALLGPSRILVLGPDSALLPIIAAAIVPLAAGDEARAVALAGLLAVLVGLIVIGAAIARLGFLTDLLSAPVRQGYLNGIALIVVVSQLPRLFGFSADGDSVLERGGVFLTGVRDGETNTVALAIGVACLAIILGLRYRWPRVPGILIAVVGVDDRLGRPRPRGARRDRGRRAASRRAAAAAACRRSSSSDILAVAPAAFGIALVAATDTSVLSRSFSSRRGEEVDQDRELLALGGANLATGLFTGMPVSSSASRTPVAEAAGAQTQMTSVVAALAIGVRLVAAPGILADLPTATLAAVVIAAGLSLVDVGLDCPSVAHRVVRILARPRELLRRRAHRRHRGRLPRCRPVAARLHPAFVVASRRRARPGRRGQGLPRPDVLPGGAPGPGPRPLSVRCAALLRQRRRVPRSGAQAHQGGGILGPLGDRRCGADHRRRHHRRGDARSARGGAGAGGHHPGIRRAEGPGPRPATTLWGPRADPRGNIYPTVGTAVSAYVRASGEPWTDWEEDDRVDVQPATEPPEPPR